MIVDFCKFWIVEYKKPKVIFQQELYKYYTLNYVIYTSLPLLH